jgi:acetyl-CoA synthetase
MSDKVYSVPAEWASRAFIDNEKYLQMYKRSLEDPNGFWGEVGKRIDWIKPYTRVKNTSYDPKNVSIKWYEDGTLNVCANCVDRHLKNRADQVAIIWEGDDPTMDEKITYRQLHERVCKFANRVTIYLPMIPEAAYAILACARIGAVHSVVFGGFSPDSLAGRIVDCDSKFIVTADEGVRGGRPIPLKKNTDEALKKGKGDEKVLVVRRTGSPVPWSAGRDIWLHEELVKVDADCAAVEMSAEDPLFILYTSGSTGKPKGVLHTGGGYLVFASLTHQHVFDYHDGDIYWCTADVGWVTGHSYILYGPLSNGADVRRRAELSHALALLARDRQVGRQHLLHRADRHPRHHGHGRRLREAHGPLVAEIAGHGGRADQSGGVDVVLQHRGRSPMPDR